jgi:hypothetical protein
MSTPTKGLKFYNGPPIKWGIFVHVKQFRIKVCLGNKSLIAFFPIRLTFYLKFEFHRGALFEVIRKVACAQISNMRMVLRISLSDCSQYHSHVADLRTRNFANDFK